MVAFNSNGRSDSASTSRQSRKATPGWLETGRRLLAKIEGFLERRTSAGSGALTGVESLEARQLLSAAPVYVGTTTPITATPNSIVTIDLTTLFSDDETLPENLLVSYEVQDRSLTLPSVIQGYSDDGTNLYIEVTEGNGDIIVKVSGTDEELQTTDASITIQLRATSGVIQEGSQSTVNTTFTDSNNNPTSTAKLSDGGYVVTWMRTDSSFNSSVWGRLYASDGTAVASEFQVASSTNTSLYEAQVSGLAGGGFVVVWTGDGSEDGGDDHGIFGRRFNNLGVAEGAVFQVNTTQTGPQNNAQVAGLADGGFVVAWESPDDGAPGADVVARRYDPSFNPANEFLVNAVTGGIQAEIAVIGTSSNGFVVSWSSDYSDIYANAYDSSSDLSWATHVTAGLVPGGCRTPALLERPNGEVMVAWSGGLFPEVTGIISANLQSNGLVSRFSIVNTDQAGGQTSPTVTALENDWYVVAWQGVDSEGNADIRAQVFEGTGVLAGAEFRVNSDWAGQQRNPDVVPVDGGLAFAVVWRTEDDLGQYDVASQLFSTDFAPQMVGATTQTIVNGGALTLDMAALFSDDHDLDDALTFNFTVLSNTSTTGEALFTLEPGDDPAGLTHILTGVTGENGTAYVEVSATDSNGNTTTKTITVNVSWTKTGVYPTSLSLATPSGAVANGGKVAVGSDGAHVVVWTDDDGVEGAGVFSQLFDADGNAVGTATQISYTGQQFSPAVAVAADGTFVVSFVSLDGSWQQIIAQMYDNCGCPLGTPFVVSTTTTGATDPAMGMAADGSFVVTWSSDDGDLDGIFGQRFDATGAKVGAEFAVNSSTTSGQTISQIAVASDGSFVVTWDSQGQDLDDRGIFAQRFDSNGDPLGTEFQVNTFTSNMQTSPSIAMAADGSFVIAWMSLGQDGDDWGVYAQMFDSTGTPVGGEFAVADMTADGQMTPSVGVMPSGAFVIAWNNDSSKIYGQYFENTGAPSGEAFEVNTASTVGVNLPSVAVGSDYKFMIAWTDVTDVKTSGGDIWVQRYAVNSGPVASPIPSVAMTEDGSESYLDLSAYFSDADEPSSSLTYSVVNNTNPGLISTDLVDSPVLVIINEEFQYGTAVLTVRATDAEGLYAETTINVSVTGSIDRHLVPVGLAQKGSGTGESPMFPNIAVAADGSYVLVWVKDGLSDIVGQRYGADGLPAGSEFTISQGTELQTNPSVAMAWDGSFVVTWAESVAAEWDIYARQFDNTGTPVGNAFIVNTTVTGAQQLPSVSATYDGRFVIAWGTDAGVLSGQRFDASGAKLGSEFLISDGTYTGEEMEVSVAVNPDSGAFVAVWTLSTVDDMGEIIGRQFDDAGVGGTAFLVNATSDDCQCAPSVATAPDGSFVVVWESEGTTGVQVFGQQYEGDGTPLGAEFIISGDSEFAFDPDVGMAGDGTFVATWLDGGSDGSQFSVRAQRYETCGCDLGPVVIVADDTVDRFDMSVSVGVAPTGNLAVGWYSQSTVDDDQGVYSRAYTLSYQPVLIEPIPDQIAWYYSQPTEIDLWDYFYNGSSLTYTIVNNTNPGAVFAEESEGLVYLNAEAAKGSAVITVKAEAVDGSYLTTDINVTARKAVLVLEPGTLTYSGNLLDAGLFEDFNGDFIGLLGFKGGIIVDFELDETFPFSTGDFTVTLTGDAGEGLVGIEAINDCGCPIELTMFIVVTEPASFEGFLSLPSKITAAVGSVDLFFSGAIEVTSFNWESVTLSRNGGPNLIDASTGAGLTFTLVNADSNRYRIGGLSSLTGDAGEYVLTLVDGSLVDENGLTIGEGGEIDWLRRPVAPTGTVLATASQFPVGTDKTFTDRPTIEGFATPGSVVKLFDGAVQIGASTEVGSDGKYSIVTSSLAQGAHTIIAKATVESGGGEFVSAGSTPYIIEVNATKFTTITQNTALRTTPVAYLIANVTQAVNIATFTSADITLTLDGVPVDTTGIVVTLAGPGFAANACKLTLPSSMTLTPGDYVLTVHGANIQTPAGAPVANDVESVWTMQSLFTSITQPSTPRTAEVTSLIVNTTTPIDISTFTHEDITLTLDSVPVDTTGIIIALAGAGYAPNAVKITLPAGMTVLAGAYVLTVNGANILTTYGTPMDNNIGAAWLTQAQFTSMTQPSTPRSSPVTELIVYVSTALNMSTFTTTDVSLTRNSTPVDLTGMTIALAGAGYPANAVRISMPAGMTQQPGDYQLTVFGANIQTQYGQPVVNDISSSWTMQTQFTGVTQPTTPRATPVTEIIVNVSAALNMSTFTASAVTLTRDSNNVDLTGMTIALAGAGYAANAVKITLPAGTTAQPGAYVLTVAGATVQSTYGDAVANNASTSWTMQTQFTGITQPTTPRSTSVTEIIVNVSAALNMSTFTASAVSLTRDASPVDLTGLTIALAGAGYAANAVKITLPSAATYPPGNYVLTVAGATVQSTYGDAVANDVSTSWTMQARLSSITQFSSPRSTPVTTVIVNPTHPVNMTAFTTAMLTLTRDGNPVDVSTIVISLAGAGYAANAVKLTLAPGLTTDPGDYVLTVLGTSLPTTYGPVFANDISTLWSKS